jgi:hypothetical protein
VHSSSGRKRSNASLVFSVFACLLSLPPVEAQVAGTGTIQGTVTDITGAAVPRASVTVTEPATGRVLTVVSSSSGTYIAPALVPGEYTVQASAQGFEPLLQQHVHVNAIEVVGLNLALTVGSAQQTVVVSAAPAALDTENGSIETTLTSDTYTALPLALNGGPKNPLGFLTLVPGVSNGDLSVPNINGGPSNSAFLYLNGLPVTTSEVQGDTRNITGSTSTEVVDQFQVITSGVPAYYAGQGITNLVSKSGTNKLHGDLYENIRNTAFDAGGFFPLPATPKPVEHQNEYGVAVGGAIRHDRLFFFGNYDRFSINQGNNPTAYSLPTAAERTGDFSALSVPIFDPASTVCANGVCTRTQFPNNVIPQARLSKVSQSLQSYLPATQNAALQDNFQNAFNSGSTQNTYLGKLDGTINAQQHAYVLVQYGKNAPVGLPPNGGPQLPLPYASTRIDEEIIWLGQIGHTWIISPHIVNVFGAQFNRYNTPFLNPTNSGNYPATAGLTGLPSGFPSVDFPPVGFSGPDSPTPWAVAGNTQNVDETANTFTYQDNLNIARGKHSLTLGGQVILQQENTSIPSNLSGFNFTNLETAGFNGASLIPTQGNAYASFLLGSVDNAGATDTTIRESGARYKDYAVYVQDDYKATQKLTVNLGTRYTVPRPYTEVLNRDSWFNPKLPNAAVDNFAGAIQFAGSGPDSCQCNTQVATHYTAIDPRLGLAFSLTSHTVIRAAYGINHYNGGALGGNAQSGGVSQLGFAANPSFTSPDSGITPAFAWDAGLPAYQHAPFFSPTLNTGYNTAAGNTGGTVGYNRPDTAGRSPYSENWNLTLSQALSSALTMQISYAGSESHFIGTNGGVGIFSNQVLPQYEALGSLLTQTLTPAVLARRRHVSPRSPSRMATSSARLDRRCVHSPSTAACRISSPTLAQRAITPSRPQCSCGPPGASTFWPHTPGASPSTTPAALSTFCMASRVPPTTCIRSGLRPRKRFPSSFRSTLSMRCRSAGDTPLPQAG